MNMTREQAREYIVNHPEIYLEPDKCGKGHVCPICNSGNGPNGTGLETKDGIHFSCFGNGSCFKNSDVLDIIGQKYNLTDFNSKLKKAAEIYGITIEQNYSTQSAGLRESLHESSSQERPIKKIAKKKSNTAQIHDYTTFFIQANKDLKETEYYRGITLETLNRFNVGYVPEWRHPDVAETVPTSPRLIIPTSKYSYIARATDTKTDAKYKKMKVGAVHMLNIDAIKNAKAPIFIVEGEIDALSIIDVNGEAVGLGSTSSIPDFLRYVEKNPPEQPLIISLDNDGAGEKKSKELLEGLAALNIKAFECDISGAYKDANEALNVDRAKFKETIESQTELIKVIALKEKRDRIIADAAITAIPEFKKHINDSTKAKSFSTGFSDLDELLDGGLYAGLYIVGAISSLGKTTFCLQVADQIAQAGNDVLIFSLEMAKDELIAKSISRLTAIEAMKQTGTKTDAKTTRGILTGSKYKSYTPKEKALIKNALEKYEEYAGHIYLTEGIGDIGVKQIREKIKDYKDVTGHSPVVLIDYLQILAPADIRASDKQNTDKAVLELKRISRDYNIPVIGISSFNRENYSSPVNLTSFKESGAIEYSSDVLIGLQYKGMDYDREKNESDKQPQRLHRISELLREQIERGKNGNAQDIQVKILKNRNGRKGDALLKFYPMYNLFEGLTEIEKEAEELNI